jgi:hypothetical protein
MFKYFKLFITTGFFSFFLQACGNNASKKKQPTAVGHGTSFSTTDVDTSIDSNKPTLEDIGQRVGEILKSEILTINEQEATEFTNETTYCDISGLKESQTTGSYEKILSSKQYESCQNENYVQHGNVQLEYSNMDDEGKYPKIISLNISNNYLFNSTQFKKDFKVESTVTYHKNKSIKSINLKINGNLNYENTNYNLQNVEQVINY